MTTRPSLLAVLAVGAALALAGCASPSSPGTDPAGAASDADQAPAADPATGDEIVGDGYSYRVPEDWGVPEQSMPGFTPDTLAMDLDDADGFADNVNTLFSPAGEVPVDEIETAGRDELESYGATDVAIRDRATIDGNEAAHIQAVLSQNDVDYWVEQFYVSNAGELLVITFSFSHEMSEAERDAVSDAVLASWSWD